MTPVAGVMWWLAGLVAACWAPPVPGPVVEPFRAPLCEFCAGHRGLEFSSPPGSAVVAVEAGVVTFSGSVAGIRYVVVAHADGIRATYGSLAATEVGQGQRVVAGQRLGTSGPRLYFGLRRGQQYLDPGPWFGRPAGRPRLVPLDGRYRRPGRAGRVCGT
jgi:murein DD-endopeptidase MepM/ murein hydrolase activator NlpD